MPFIVNNHLTNVCICSTQFALHLCVPHTHTHIYMHNRWILKSPCFIFSIKFPSIDKYSSHILLDAVPWAPCVYVCGFFLLSMETHEKCLFLSMIWNKCGNIISAVMNRFDWVAYLGYTIQFPGMKKKKLYFLYENHLMLLFFTFFHHHYHHHHHHSTQECDIYIKISKLFSFANFIVSDKFIYIRLYTDYMQNNSHKTPTFKVR